MPHSDAAHSPSSFGLFGLQGVLFTLRRGQSETRMCPKRASPLAAPSTARNTLTYQNLLLLWVLIISPTMEFIGTLQKSRFWSVKVGVSLDTPLFASSSLSFSASPSSTIATTAAHGFRIAERQKSFRGKPRVHALIRPRPAGAGARTGQVYPCALASVPFPCGTITGDL